jgi:hypothetical protein
VRKTSARQSLAAAILAALFLAGLAAPALPGATLDRQPTIRAVRAKADAFVSGAKRETNFGRADDLKVDGAPRVRAYMRFNVNVKSGDVRRVNLLLWSRTTSRAGCQVRLVYDPWRERAITFANAPDLSPESIASGPLKARAWKAVDVTSLTDQVSGDDDSVSLALTTGSTKSLELASRESGLHAPRLVVVRGGREGEQPAGSTETP